MVQPYQCPELWLWHRNLLRNARTLNPTPELSATLQSMCTDSFEKPISLGNLILSTLHLNLLYLLYVHYGVRTLEMRHTFRIPLRPSSTIRHVDLPDRTLTKVIRYTPASIRTLQAPAMFAPRTSQST